MNSEPDELFDDLYLKSNSKNQIDLTCCIKILIFIFIIYLILNSNLWCQHTLKKFNLIDDMNNIYLTGHILNAIILGLVIILLIFMILSNYL